MNIGIAGPISLRMLADKVERGDQLPEGYSAPLIALFVIELLQRGHDVTVFALDPSTTAPRTFRGHSLRIHVGRYRRRHRARDAFKAERTDLLAAMRGSNCDLIHAHWTYEFAMAALESGHPYLITAHDAPLTILRFMPTPYRLVRFMMAMHVIRRARRMTAVSPYVADHLRRLGRRAVYDRVVPNGIPDSVFATPGNRPETGSTRPLTFATVLTGWGRLKNSKAALHAYALFRQHTPRSRLVMFGAGHGPNQEAQQWALQEKIADGVDFKGSVPHGDLLRYLRENVDVLVHPSLEEAHPMTICEAMAVGVPVIAGRASGGVPFALEHGNAGLLVDVKVPTSIVRAMTKLATDVGYRESLSHIGEESVRRRFHIDSMVDGYTAVYKETIRDLEPSHLRIVQRRYEWV